MSPKEKQFSFRFTEELNDKIENVIQLMAGKTGLKVTKTQVIESAIEEGLKVITSKLEVKE